MSNIARNHCEDQKLAAEGQTVKPPLWNSLEIAKLFGSLVTGLVLAYVAYEVNRGFRDADVAAQLRARASEEATQQRAVVEASRQKELDEANRRATRSQLAVSELSKLIYERRVRSDLLRESIVRFSKYRSSIFKAELIARRRNYEASFVDWNRNTQANLLLIRTVLNKPSYDSFQRAFEKRMVLLTFKPIHLCLDRGFELVMRGGDPLPVFESCKIEANLVRALGCGFSFTDQLWRASTPSAVAVGPLPDYERLCSED